MIVAAKQQDSANRFKAKIKALGFTVSTLNKDELIYESNIVSGGWLRITFNLTRRGIPGKPVTIQMQVPGSQWPNKSFSIEQFEQLQNDAIQKLAFTLLLQKSEIKSLRAQAKALQVEADKIAQAALAAM